MDQLHLMKQVFAEAKVKSLQGHNSTLFPSAILFFPKGLMIVLCQFELINHIGHSRRNT